MNSLSSDKMWNIGCASTFDLTHNIYLNQCKHLTLHTAIDLCNFNSWFQIASKWPFMMVVQQVMEDVDAELSPQSSYQTGTFVLSLELCSHSYKSMHTFSIGQMHTFSGGDAVIIFLVHFVIWDDVLSFFTAPTWPYIFSHIDLTDYSLDYLLVVKYA